MGWKLEIKEDQEESDEEEEKSPQIEQAMNRSAQNPLWNSLGSDKVVSATKQRGINNLNSTLPNSSRIPGIAQKHKHESFDFSSTGGSITKKNEI